MSEPGGILRTWLLAANPAWVPAKPQGAAAVPANDVALALRLLDQSARAWRYDRELALNRTSNAAGLLGPDAVLNLQGDGKLPARAATSGPVNRIRDLMSSVSLTITTICYDSDGDTSDCRGQVMGIY